MVGYEEKIHDRRDKVNRKVERTEEKESPSTSAREALPWSVA
jgi:hypothetical protein